MVSLSKGSKKGGSGSALGFAFILSSLACDGVTGGAQKRLKGECAARGVRAKPYDFMFWTNVYMLAVASVLTLLSGEAFSGARLPRLAARRTRTVTHTYFVVGGRTR